ncbi:NDR1/HIN1-like protein 3 [Cynara cardunculus var. scolymus]|uniref:Late embryogenesis abundant protein, LEA-14 n=1 Tax=Cynara cardunculus var. scolymus TaxID=59895 RepID=A0A124SH39_CYNCS|nr:NDR1/HIN1-like protein 3 [Cynara cardunculus var. scolymus]KVI08342.1 Late embryogenesis abundant protein, LEA-14 [Cynara cardunculus var. scolymus]
MSAPDQPHLNGAYYGPSIPPPTKKSKSYHRPGRGGGSSCNPFSWCCSCLCGCVFNLVFQILITILVLLGIAVLVFWLIFRPNAPKFHVNDAVLTQFNLSPDNNTLYYNLAVNMTFRNPNRRIGIYYDKIQANAEYHDRRFATRDLETFYLGHKKEKDVGTVFSGSQVVVLGDDRSRYDSERSDGVYYIDLKLRLRIRLKVGWAKPKFKPRFECDLRIPMGSGGRAQGGFQRTKCDVDW